MPVHGTASDCAARLCAVTLIALGLLAASSLHAQEAATSTDPDPAVQAMEPLVWLAGDWEGEGWIQRGPEGRIEFTQTEHVESVLGGRLLLVEGLGRTKIPEGEGPIGHHAFGVLSWNPEEGTYRFDTYLADGAGIDARATVENGVFTWGFDTPKGKVRYLIRQTEDGKWHETGDFSPDGGATWLPFFATMLDRVEDLPETPSEEAADGGTGGSGR
jgi:hypothetical protein